MNFTTKILLENSTNYNEKNMIRALESTEKAKLDNVMVSNLYKSTIDKAHIDFDSIPETKGDITKYKGYPIMMETLTTIETLASKNNVKIDEIEVIRTAISHLRAYQGIYQDGFALRKTFIELQYNTLVLACVEATTSLVTSYMDYLKRIDTIEFTIIKNRTNNGSHCIEILRQYNNSVKTGEYQKFLNAIVKNKEGFVGMDTAMIGMVIAGGALAIVPLLRELIFYFYYTRMKASEYLELQAMMLEINRTHIESMNMNPKKKKEILKKQEQTMNKMLKLSEKIKVSQKVAKVKSMEEVKKEEKNWSLDNLKKEVVRTDSTFTLL